MPRPRLLFAPETMDLAETTRALVVADALGDRAEVTFMGYGGPVAYLVTDAGYPLHQIEPRYDTARPARAWRADRMESLRSPFSTSDLRARVANELAMLDRLRPDLVFIGFTLSLYLSARIHGTPLVQLVPFAFTRPFFHAGLATWPDQLRLPVPVPAGWLDALVTKWATRTRMWMRPFRAVSRHYGYPAPSRLPDLWVADYNLVAEIPQVTGVPELPPGWEYVGPVFARLDGAIPDEIANLPDGEPWIYCAMGSSGQADAVAATLDALGQLPYRVFAPVRDLLPDGYTPPSNVTVLGWLPAHEVNPLARLAVIHGGQGTVQTAVGSGTPFVGIGMQPEQEWNIDMLVRAGTARRVSRRDITPTAITAAVHDLIDNTQAHATATELATLYAQHDGAATTANRLLDLADTNPTGGTNATSQITRWSGSQQPHHAAPPP